MTAKTMGLVSGEALPLCAPVVDRNDGTNGINCSITKDAKAEVLWRLNDSPSRRGVHLPVSRTPASRRLLPLPPRLLALRVRDSLAQACLAIQSNPECHRVKPHTLAVVGHVEILELTDYAYMRRETPRYIYRRISRLT